MTDIIDTTKPVKRTRRMAREPKPAAEGQASIAAPTPKARRPDSKSGLVLQLLQRPEGATIAQIVTATGWLPHSARAFMTGLRKKGHNLVRECRTSGETTWRIER